jgi:uracil-DNA glycosylase family 4
VLIVGEFPGYYEILNGYPFAGPSGEILMAELDRVGIRLSRCRQTNLWLHAIPPTHTKEGKKRVVNALYEVEAKWHNDKMMEELIHPARKVAFLMGSDVARYFGYGSISDVTGLVVKSLAIPKHVKAVASYNPAIAEYGTIGEIRLATETLARHAKGLWK